MSWITALSALYEANKDQAGEIKSWGKDTLVLMPPGYDTIKAQIEVTIDEDGEFINAIQISPESARTIVPYPDRRTSGIKALPLCDSLEYVAGDYTELVKSSKGNRKSREKFQSYFERLSSWHLYDPTNDKIRALLRYIEKKSLIADLIRFSVIPQDDSGNLSDSTKIQKTTLDKVFVRFRVYTANASDVETATWLDKSIQKSFLDFYLSTAETKDLCYFTGDRALSAKTNPVKIRGEWDTKASLISSNDSSNFSYRGRFLTKDKDTGYNEAVSVGYEMSQKIHNALKWIIRRQGFSRDGVCVVTWESNLLSLPEFYDGSLGILENQVEEDIFGEVEEESTDTNYVTANDFNMALDGYMKQIDDASRMVILALDSASPGRLAITYFKELNSSDYLLNIQKWQESCCWRHDSFNKNKKYFQYEGVPSLRKIAEAVYGTEQSKRLVLRSSGDKSPMMASIFERLRPCILEGRRIPLDIVKTVAVKAANPVAYESAINYRHVLHTACSLVKKYYWDKGVKFDMVLDENCTNRSYLFGRLLAIAEKIERTTFDQGETRVTNAERYMRQFSQTPFRTWELIRKSTQVHLNQIRPGSREFYKNLYAEIEGLFDEGAFEDKKPLDGRFLLGYDCQREALKKSSEKNQANENTEKSEDIN